MFEGITALPPDPILGLIAAFAADENPDKIDLGVGVYRDELGGTPILDCVREAEKILLDTQTTKTYLGPRGVVGFNDATRALLLGKDSRVIAEDRAALAARRAQGPGKTRASPRSIDFGIPE